MGGLFRRWVAGQYHPFGGRSCACGWTLEFNCPNLNASSSTNQVSWIPAPVLSLVICQMDFVNVKENSVRCTWHRLAFSSRSAWQASPRGLPEVQEMAEREEDAKMDKEGQQKPERLQVIGRTRQIPGEGRNCGTGMHMPREPPTRPGQPLHCCLMSSGTVVIASLPKMACQLSRGSVRVPSAGRKR